MRPTEHFALAKIFSVRGTLLLAVGCCLPESDSPAQPLASQRYLATEAGATSIASMATYALAGVVRAVSMPV